MKPIHAVLPPGNNEQLGQWLYDNQFVQTSRKYRMLARLPVGTKDACALLAESEIATMIREGRWVSLSLESKTYWIRHFDKWAYGMGQMHAARHWYSCHAQHFDDCTIELDSMNGRYIFDHYRKVGGDMWPWFTDQLSNIARMGGYSMAVASD